MGPSISRRVASAACGRVGAVPGAGRFGRIPMHLREKVSSVASALRYVHQLNLTDRIRLERRHAR